MSEVLVWNVCVSVWSVWEYVSVCKCVYVPCKQNRYNFVSIMAAKKEGREKWGACLLKVERKKRKRKEKEKIEEKEELKGKAWIHLGFIPIGKIKIVLCHLITFLACVCDA